MPWRLEHDFSFEPGADPDGNEAHPSPLGLNQWRPWLAPESHDSLAALLKNELRKHPLTGTVLVFRARKANRLKLLHWDGTGLVT